MAKNLVKTKFAGFRPHILTHSSAMKLGSEKRKSKCASDIHLFTHATDIEFTECLLVSGCVCSLRDQEDLASALKELPNYSNYSLVLNINESRLLWH